MPRRSSPPAPTKSVPLPFPGLTPKQQAFVDAYLGNGRNGSDAYRQAYGAKSSQPHSKAIALLKHKVVASIVTEADRLVTIGTLRGLARYEITAERVAEEMALLAFSNMGDYVVATEDGHAMVPDFSKLTREQTAAISEVTIEEFMDGKGEGARQVRRVKFKLYDKKGALELIGRDVGKFLPPKTDDKPATVNNNLFLKVEALDGDERTILRRLLGKVLPAGSDGGSEGPRQG